ncbi:hypothetical protein [Aliagarivorans taiwanensis]|uniref:hypothetical protein n=1 Tax=Aliagarivorans taiwanensis TaxID=561966 RepID=UPI0003F50F47|nr:hypothetical protein [Aliagarivorans taiwanensis]
MAKMTRKDANSLVAIGFCIPRFYKPAVWAKAKRLMDNVVCPAGLATAHDFGRGKGKYTSPLDITDVQKQTLTILEQQGRLAD